MNYKTINFRLVCGAIKHQLKIILLTILVFALAGAGAGYWYASGTKVEAAGRADALASVDYSLIPYNYNYYRNSLEYLVTCYNNANSYLNTLLQDANPNAEQRARLADSAKRLKEFDGEALMSVQALLRPRDTLFIPPEFQAEAISRYEVSLRNLQLDMIEAEIAKELIETMDSPDVADNNSISTYNSLLSLAAEYGNDKMKEQEYTAILDQLKNHPDQILAQSRQAEEQLLEVAERLNGLTEELCQIADEVASENSVIVSVSYSTNYTAQITLTHTHSAASPEENFTILFLFCILVGICLGLFFAVCREARIVALKSSEKPSETAEKTGACKSPEKEAPCSQPSGKDDPI